MIIEINYKTYDGRESIKVDSGHIPTWKKNVIHRFDKSISDIIAILLESDCCSAHELYKQEVLRNISQGKPMSAYVSNYRNGTLQTADDLYDRYSYIWSSYFFTESTNANFELSNWLRQFSNKRSMPTSDQDIMLFLTARLCVWGGYDFYHKFSLYKKIIDKRHIEFIKEFNLLCETNSWMQDMFTIEN